MEKLTLKMNQNKNPYPQTLSPHMQIIASKFFVMSHFFKKVFDVDFTYCVLGTTQYVPRKLKVEQLIQYPAPRRGLQLMLQGS